MAKSKTGFGKVNADMLPDNDSFVIKAEAGKPLSAQEKDAAQSQRQRDARTRRNAGLSHQGL